MFFLFGWMLAASLWLGAGCSSSTTAIPGVPCQEEAEKRLRSEIRKWRGTPHRMGGTDRSGADCSGFVMAVCEKIFGIRLPRTAAEQMGAGVGVGTARLRAGDLVFFRVSRKNRHVGIYLGHGEFAHVSAIAGVTVSLMDDGYWRGRCCSARRIIPGG